MKPLQDRTYIEHSFTHNYGLGSKKNLTSKAKERYSKWESSLNNEDVLKVSIWQNECIQILRNCIYCIIHAATGAGKSMAMQLLTYIWLKNNPRKLALIVVPQQAIADGFSPKEIEAFGEIICLCPTVFKSDNQKEVVKSLLNALELKPKHDNIPHYDRTFVCTHQTITALFEKLSIKKRKKIFSELILWIDEAHHLKTEEYEVEGESLYIGNSLTKVVEYSIDNGCSVNLTTATLFRGDGEMILKPEYMNKFNKYGFPFDRYMDERCEFLKSIKYNWVMYDEDYFNGVKKVFKVDPHKRSIIYLPSIGSGESKTIRGLDGLTRYKSKRKEVFQVMTAICPSFDETKHKHIHPIHKCIYYKVPVKEKKLIIVDIVKESGRNNVMNYIAAENKKQNPEIDIIISLGVFKEGADYCAIQRCLIVGRRGSTVDLVQTSGRSFRDWVDKLEAEVYHLLPICQKEAYDNIDEFRSDLNLYINQFVYSILLQDQLSPKLIRLKKINKNGKEKIIKEHVSKRDIWEENIGERKQHIQKEIIKEYVSKRSTINSSQSHERNMDLARSICYKVLKKEGITNNKLQNKLFIEFQFMFCKKRRPNKWYTLKEKEQLMEKSIAFESMDIFVSKSMGVKIFSDLRKKWKFEYFNDEDVYNHILKTVDETGELPQKENAKTDLDHIASLYCQGHEVEMTKRKKKHIVNLASSGASKISKEHEFADLFYRSIDHQDPIFDPLFTQEIKKVSSWI